MPDRDLAASQSKSENDLRELIRQAQDELQQRQDAKRQQAEDQIRKIIADNDLDPHALFAKLTKTKKKKKKTAAPSGPAKYRNPGNSAETWNGKGRHPKWYDDARDRGITEEQLAIVA